MLFVWKVIDLLVSGKHWMPNAKPKPHDAKCEPPLVTQFTKFDQKSHQ